MEPKVPPKCECTGCKSKKKYVLNEDTKQHLVLLWHSEIWGKDLVWKRNTYLRLSQRHGDTALAELGLELPEIKKK